MTELQMDDDMVERAALVKDIDEWLSGVTGQHPSTAVSILSEARALLASPVREPEAATPALERVRRYLHELDAFYGDDEIDDVMDNADGGHESAALLLSDIRVLAAMREPEHSEPEVITSAAELAALPPGSVVMTEVFIERKGVTERRVWQKFAGEPDWQFGHPRHEWQATDGGFERVGEAYAGTWLINRRATVLYRPERVTDTEGGE